MNTEIENDIKRLEILIPCLQTFMKAQPGPAEKVGRNIDIIIKNTFAVHLSAAFGYLRNVGYIPTAEEWRQDRGIDG